MGEGTESASDDFAGVELELPTLSGPPHGPDLLTC